MTSAVVRFRSGAARFRRNRQRVERELFEGNIDALERLSRVLQGDVRDLTDRAGRIAGTALELADTGVKAMVPVPFGPKTAAGLVPGATRSWFRERWLRLFRPQLWCVYDLGRNGRRIGNVVGVSFERFRLQTGVATEPLQFLDRLGDVRNPS
jgi:hypothetical protein